MKNSMKDGELVSTKTKSEPTIKDTQILRITIPMEKGQTEASIKEDITKFFVSYSPTAACLRVYTPRRTAWSGFKKLFISEWEFRRSDIKLLTGTAGLIAAIYKEFDDSEVVPLP